MILKHAAGVRDHLSASVSQHQVPPTARANKPRQTSEGEMIVEPTTAPSKERIIEMDHETSFTSPESIIEEFD